jgi:hypothetical protein
MTGDLQQMQQLADRHTGNLQDKCYNNRTIIRAAVTRVMSQTQGTAARTNSSQCTD